MRSKMVLNILIKKLFVIKLPSRTSSHSIHYQILHNELKKYSDSLAKSPILWRIFLSFCRFCLILCICYNSGLSKHILYGHPNITHSDNKAGFEVAKSYIPNSKHLFTTPTVTPLHIQYVHQYCTLVGWFMTHIFVWEIT